MSEIKGKRRLSPKKEQQEAFVLEFEESNESTTEDNSKKIKLDDDAADGILGNNCLKSEELQLGSFLFNEAYVAPEVDGDESNSNLSQEQQICDELLDNTKDPLLTQRKPAWVDQDDETYMIEEKRSNILLDKHKRGKHRGEKIKYKDVLEKKFTEVYGLDPEWAKLGENEDTPEFDLSKKIMQYRRDPQESQNLPGDAIKYRVIPKLQQKGFSSNIKLSSMEFHERTPCVMVAGTHSNSLGVVSFYQVDGEANNHIQTIKLKNFPISCAKFYANGTKYVLGSDKHTFCLRYDMQTGHQQKMPFYDHGKNMFMKKFEVSPDGKYIIFYNNEGRMDLFDGVTMSFIEQMGVPTTVNSVSFTSNSDQMFVYGDNGFVYVYEMRMRECNHRFYDEGSIKGTAIAVSPNSRFLACGCSSGIVNIYDRSSIYEATPKPIKVINKLLTAVSDLQFNHSSEILAMSSKNKLDSFKLIHTPTMHVFQNLPNLTKPFNKFVGGVSFSPNSGYMSLASNLGEARLLRLEHYKSY